VLDTEWDDDDLAAQVFQFLVAGFDTTSTLLCFAAHQLAVHPDVQSRLQEEIDMTLNKDGGNLTYEAVHGMKYLDMVLSGMGKNISCCIVPDQKMRLGLQMKLPEHYICCTMTVYIPVVRM
jgi:cytochrome P450 family 9